MHTINVKANEWHRYKNPEAILTPGTYIVPQGQFDKDEMKKLYTMIAATNVETNRFNWLIQIKKEGSTTEQWITRELLGTLNLLKLDAPIDTSRVEKKLKILKPSMYPWQIAKMEEILKTIKAGYAYRKGLIAGLGAGKTLVFLLSSFFGPTLYIAPKHLHSTIKDECDKWEFPIPHITTAASALKNKLKLEKLGEKIAVGIIDESLVVKNPKAQRTVGVMKALEDAIIILPGTATPLSGKRVLDASWIRVAVKGMPAEPKHWMHRWGINPHLQDLRDLGVTSPPTYEDHEGNVREKTPLVVDGWGIPALTEYIKPFIDIVDTKDLLASLPEKTLEKVFFPRPPHFMAIKRGLATKKSVHKIISQLRTCTSGFVYGDAKEVHVQKYQHKINWLKNFIEDNPDENLFIISNWQAEQEMLKEALKEYNPAMNTSTESNIEEFTSGKTQYLISSASLSEGMNLQDRCRIGIVFSYPSSPDKWAQMQGRLYRPGQKHAVVFYLLIAKDTLDETAIDALENYAEENEEFIESLLKQKTMVLLGMKENK